MKKILLASDYDGTLLIRGVISRENKEAIKRFREKGFLFALNSGRGYRKYGDFEVVELCDYFICNNGSYVVDRNGKEICCHKINKESYAFIKEVCKRNKVRYYYVDSLTHRKPVISKFYFSNIYQIFREYFSSMRKVLGRVKDDEIVQVSIPIGEEEKRARVIEELNGNKELTVHSNGLFIDINKNGCDKSKGLEELNNIEQFDVIYTIGDELNDYEMLKNYKGFRIISGNAGLKEVCDYEVNSVKEAIEIIEKENWDE